VKVDLIRPLSGAALEVLSSLPRVGEFVFRPLPAFGRLKRDLDDRAGVRGWRLHDLRRTGRTLLSRAGVNADHAERVLGHKLPGIRGRTIGSSTTPQRSMHSRHSPRRSS